MAMPWRAVIDENIGVAKIVRDTPLDHTVYSPWLAVKARPLTYSGGAPRAAATHVYAFAANTRKARNLIEFLALPDRMGP